MTDNYSPYRQVVVERPETNVEAVVGFTMAILSWLTCGILSIPSAIVCIVGMQGDRPKGLAIAGFIISLPPLLLMLFWVFVISGPFAIIEANQKIAEFEAQQDLAEAPQRAKRAEERRLKREQEQRVRDFKTPTVEPDRPGMRFVPTVDNQN